MISLAIQNKIFYAAENWQLVIHPIAFEELSKKYKSFYRLRRKEEYTEDDEAQSAFQPISNLFSKVNNSPLSYSHPLFEIENLEDKMLVSSLQNTHKELYEELLTYLEFFVKLQEYEKNPLLEILEKNLINLSSLSEDFSKVAILIKRSYLKDSIEKEIGRILGPENNLKILTHSELVNSNYIFQDVFSFGPLFDLTPIRDSRVLLSPKFLKMNVISNSIYVNNNLKNISLLSEENGFQVSKTCHQPDVKVIEHYNGPSLVTDIAIEDEKVLSEDEEIQNLISLEAAETEEYLINQGIKKRGENDLEDELISAVIFHLSDQSSYLAPDENLLKFIGSEELDSAAEQLNGNSKANISRDKPEKISAGDVLLIFEGGEGNYTSELSLKRLGSRYLEIKSSMAKWKKRLNEFIDEKGIRVVSTELISLGLDLASTHNIRNWSSSESGGPGNRKDFHTLIKYIRLEGDFIGYLKTLLAWRKEHQKSGRELSKKITRSIQSKDLLNIKEKGLTSFSLDEFEGAEINAYLVNSSELLHRIPLNQTRKIIKKN